MKTSKKQFMAFKAEALRYMKLLNLLDYKAYFELRKMDSIARVDFNTAECSVKFTLCDDYHCEEGFDPEKSARHEVWHLFHARLLDLACWRFVRRDEILECAERMARVLTEYELV